MKEKEIQENILKIYEEPTLIGLNNIDSASFINSILQCLCQIPSLINYFLKDSNKGVIMNNNTSFSPYDFMETVEKINLRLKKGKKMVL